MSVTLFGIRGEKKVKLLIHCSNLTPTPVDQKSHNSTCTATTFSLKWTALKFPHLLQQSYKHILPLKLHKTKPHYVTTRPK